MAPDAAPDLANGRQVYERLLKVQQAFTLEVRTAAELVLQQPPEGNFDYTDLVWTERVSKVGKARQPALVLEALIPSDAVSFWLRGEALRCDVDKFPWSGCTAQTATKGAYCFYNCPCAGKPEPAVAGAREEKARGPAKTASKKVGCPMRFSTTRSLDSLTVLITYICPAHADACCVQSPRRVSPEAKKRAYDALVLDKDLTAVQLVERNAAEVSRAYAQKHSCTPAEAITLFNTVRVRRFASVAHAACGARRAARGHAPCTRAAALFTLTRADSNARVCVQEHTCAPSDYWFSESDAWNIKSEFACLEWKLHPNVLDSLDLWAQELTRDGEVFINQSQQTGTDATGKLVETRPFIFGLCPKSTLALMRELLADGTLICDATFCACACMRLCSCGSDARVCVVPSPHALLRSQARVDALEGVPMPSQRSTRSASPSRRSCLSTSTTMGYLSHTSSTPTPRRTPWCRCSTRCASLWAWSSLRGSSSWTTATRSGDRRHSGVRVGHQGLQGGVVQLARQALVAEEPHRQAAGQGEVRPAPRDIRRPPRAPKHKGGDARVHARARAHLQRMHARPC